jgi:hypothetical protein
MIVLDILKSLYDGLRGYPKKAPKPDWHGTYLNEDGIVADILSKVKNDPVARKRWLDPDSWYSGWHKGGLKDIPEHAGCLMFAGMSIRNWYGLWHLECPYTCNEGDGLEITDGIITDARHADNLLG